MRSSAAATLLLAAVIPSGASGVSVADGGGGATRPGGKIAFIVRTDYRPVAARIHVINPDGATGEA